MFVVVFFWCANSRVRERERERERERRDANAIARGGDVCALETGTQRCRARWFDENREGEGGGD